MSEIFVTSFDWWSDASYIASITENDISSFNENHSNDISASYENSILLTTLWNWWRKNDTIYQLDEESYSLDNNADVNTFESIGQQQHNINQEQRSNKNPSVQFSHVHIREYDVTLGDHPKTKLYPISLDWTYNDNTITIDLDEHINRNIQKRFDRMIEKAKVGRSAYRLKAPERFQRITDVTGISMNQLYKMEVKRHEELHLECQQYIIANDRNEEEDEDDSLSDVDESYFFR